MIQPHRVVGWSSIKLVVSFRWLVPTLSTPRISHERQSLRCTGIPIHRRNRLQKRLTGHIKPREGSVSLDGLHEVAALVVVDIRRPQAQGLEGTARVRQIAANYCRRLVHLARVDTIVRSINI